MKLVYKYQETVLFDQKKKSIIMELSTVGQW